VTVLVAERLRKAFGARVAVDALSFEIGRGETLGLLGPNGAGKSTTIRMLVGALAPDAGRVVIDGAWDPRRPEVRRKLGLAPQELALYPELSAAENLAFFGRLHGLRGAHLRARVDAALAAAGLEERRHERAGCFSGGMQRRLNLAAALVHDPPVLLLDEPTAGVDAHSRVHLFETLARLRGEGRTVLYTTHDLEEARRLCDRVAIVDHGRLLALGTIDELVARHGGASIEEAQVEGGARLRVETDTPGAEVERLLASGARLAHLRVDRPGLEQVFLSLTGRSLRD
jgi:ABC-2 type transport system ATP-binding protein